MTRDSEGETAIADWTWVELAGRLYTFHVLTCGSMAITRSDLPELERVELVTKRSDVKQALLKPDYARLYPGIPANEWQPLSVMLDLVRRVPGHSATGEASLEPEHFMFRGQASAGSKEEARGGRGQDRKPPRRP